MASQHKGVETSPVWKKIDDGLKELHPKEGGRSVVEIAKELNVDPIYIRRIERSALDKLRSALRQFALDIGLKADMIKHNPNTKLPRITGKGMYHNNDYV